MFFFILFCLFFGTQSHNLLQLSQVITRNRIMFQKRFSLSPSFCLLLHIIMHTFKFERWRKKRDGGEVLRGRLLCMCSQQTVAKRGSHGSPTGYGLSVLSRFFFFPSASFFYSLRQLEDSSIEFARFGELRSM